MICSSPPPPFLPLLLLLLLLPFFFDVSAYSIGGLTRQLDRAYLYDSDLSTLQTDPRAFKYVNHWTFTPTARFPWSEAGFRMLFVLPLDSHSLSLSLSLSPLFLPLGSLAPGIRIRWPLGLPRVSVSRCSLPRPRLPWRGRPCIPAPPHQPVRCNFDSFLFFFNFFPFLLANRQVFNVTAARTAQQWRWLCTSTVSPYQAIVSEIQFQLANGTWLVNKGTAASRFA